MSVRLIDARSGKDVKIGDRVEYSDGSWWRLAVVTDFFFRVSVTVHTDVGLQHVWCPVRWRRTNIFPQRVAIYPS